MSTEIIKKVCSKCQQSLPATTEYFVLHRSGKDGLYGWCKACKNGVNKESRACEYCGGIFVASKDHKISRSLVCSRPCFFMKKAKALDFKVGMLTILGMADDVVKEFNGDTYKYAMYAVRCDCGRDLTIPASDITRRRQHKNISCGCYKKSMMKHGLLTGSGPAHHNWKDGKTAGFNKRYRWLYMPKHPNATKRGYVQEHIYVMSEFLGRRIQTEAGENVHHINGLKLDNRLENLELWRKHQPYGQRIEDLVAHAKYILKTYESDARKLQRLHEPADPGQLVLVR